MIKSVEKCGSESKFFENYNNVKNMIITKIKETNEYQNFISMDISTYKYDGNRWNKKSHIYKPYNDGVIFISIDLIKANYHVMQFIHPKIVLETKNYNELISKFTDDPYLKNSKYIRQVIFGNLNPKRQQHIQKYIMGQIDRAIMSQCDISDNQICCSTANEITFKVLPNKLQITLKQIKDVMKKLPQFQHMIKYEIFKLHKIKETTFYIKEFENGTFNFKGIPKMFFAQCYKEYMKKELHEFDFIFEFEKQPCKLLKPLFR